MLINSYDDRKLMVIYSSNSPALIAGSNVVTDQLPYVKFYHSEVSLSLLIGAVYDKHRPIIDPATIIAMLRK